MPVVASRFLRRSGSEESIQWENRPSCASAPSLSSHPMPFRITQESYRPRVSDRTMVGALPTDLLASFRSRIASTSLCHETPTMGTIRSGLAAKKRSRRSALRSAQATRAGAGCARNSTASSRGRRVPLDIPFYRTFPQPRRRRVPFTPKSEPAKIEGPVRFLRRAQNSRFRAMRDLYVCSISFRWFLLSPRSSERGRSPERAVR